MPAKSKKQQRFMGMVRATQRGEMTNPSESVQRAAGSMSEQDAKDFASTKHDDLPEKAANSVVIAGHRLNVPRTPPQQETGQPVYGEGVATSWLREKMARQRLSDAPQRAGDPSILNDYNPLDSVRGLRVGGPDMSNITQVLSSTTHKVAAAHKRFWSFVLPDGHLLEPRQREALVKQALYPTAGPMSQAVPMAQAQQTMSQMSGGNPMQAGSGVMPTGLDVPGMDTTAANMPGTPGHAATNVIDNQGGLDPRGITIDGNNAAGVPKGFKMAEWLAEKNAAKETSGVCKTCGAGALDDGATICADCEGKKYDDRLSRLTARRDPDGISQEPFDVSQRADSREKAANAAIANFGSSQLAEALGMAGHRLSAAPQPPVETAARPPSASAAPAGGGGESQGMSFIPSSGTGLAGDVASHGSTGSSPDQATPASKGMNPGVVSGAGGI